VADRDLLFRSSSLASGLVTQDQIEMALDQLRTPSDGPPAQMVEIHDSQLAAKLVEMGVLTAYQADQLRAGRTKLRLGPYLITDFIGQGGMGQVFKAVHKMMNREVAVKVLPLSRSTPTAIAHFTREIRLQAQLDHPNLVRAHDAGHDGNVHYLVTEYVPGTDLRRLVRTDGKLSQQQAAGVISQAAEGLGYAHQRGMLHRDIKPGNILVAQDGTTKVSDLGLAGFIQEADEDPRAGKVVGTVDYLSPDQIKNPRSITPASDIYSLGCTLYYAVTGKVPFPGGKTHDKARRHCEETPWHPHRFNPELSEDFVDVIADMMEKDPKQRIQTAEELITRLEPWATDTAPIRSQQLGKSPWMPPPPPAISDGDDELHDTDAGSDEQEGSDSRQQGTDPIASAGHETSPLRPPPRRVAPSIPQPPPKPRRSLFSPIVVALAVAIPMSALAGALLTFLLLWLIG